MSAGGGGASPPTSPRVARAWKVFWYGLLLFVLVAGYCGGRARRQAEAAGREWVYVRTQAVRMEAQAKKAEKDRADAIVQIALGESRGFLGEATPKFSYPVTAWMVAQAIVQGPSGPVPAPNLGSWLAQEKEEGMVPPRWRRVRVAPGSATPIIGIRVSVLAYEPHEDPETGALSPKGK